MKFSGIVLLKDEGHAIKSCCELLKVTPFKFTNPLKLLQLTFPGHLDMIYIYYE